MNRYILRFTGKGKAPTSAVERIHSSGVAVLDSSSPRMLLVEGSSEKVSELAEALPDWTCTTERTIQLPDPRPKVSS